MMVTHSSWSSRPGFTSEKKKIQILTQMEPHINITKVKHEKVSRN